MIDEVELRAKARATVENGKLPARRPDRTWGGPGVGAECAVCGLPVTKDQMEFEIQFARDGTTPVSTSSTSTSGASQRGSSSA